MLSIRGHRHHTSTSLCIGIIFTATVLASMGKCQMLTTEEKTSALQFVNHLRRNTVPRAADMNGLLWDDNLEFLAQKAANSCLLQHNYNGKYASLGETLYRGGQRNFSHIFMFMFLERQNYNHKNGQCIPSNKYSFFKTCGHYLQIASAGVNKIGCAIQPCNGNYLAVCEFDRQYASPPYQLGEPGTKCGNGYATYYQNGLCYGIMYGKPPPVQGPFECKLSCTNYGTLRTNPICSCKCPKGFFGARCEIKNTYYVSAIPNDCKAQAVQCKNGGTPAIFGTKCACKCQPNFSGDNCEEDIEEIENSIFIHFGGQPIYYSYYPVDLGFWNTTNLRSTIRENLTNEINAYCMANNTYCCPNSTIETSETYVTELDFQDSTDYPTNDIDGTLVAAFHYTLKDNLTMECNNSESRYLPKSILMEAWSQMESHTCIKLQAAEKGFPIVRVR